MTAYDSFYAAFPWLRDIGITAEQIQEWIVAGYEDEALVNIIRQTPQWQARFPWLRREDGTLRMSEAEAIAREDDYRQVLRRWDVDLQAYNDPASFAAFFSGEIDPNELNQRLETYDTVRRNSAAVKEAFYVYAGMQISDDDLYEATVDPTKRADLSNQYEVRTTRNPLDYNTWITRATEAGLDRVTNALMELKSQGVAVDSALARVRQLDPQFARQMLDVLLHGGDPARKDGLLSLSELMHAFEYAMIGSAASEQGLALPDKDRIEAIRQAGIQRSEAMKAYGDYARQRNQISGMVQRAQLGVGFSQDEFERAIFLRQGSAVQTLEQAQAREEALGKASGAYRFDTDQAGRVRQSGFKPALG